MKKILILGAHGMLGDAVRRYFESTKEYTILVLPTNDKWPSDSFRDAVRGADADFIINCIGKIPQRKPSDAEYQETNIDLPIFLETLETKVIHPSTDCEFKGDIPFDGQYPKNAPRDADDAYGKSKAYISRLIETSFKNTKIIRTSIIGHERNSSVSLLEWFLHSEGTVRGYTNHYWNGITTLEWAKRCERLITEWDHFPVLNQYGTSKNMSKYEVLEAIKQAYAKIIEIEPYETPETVNKCLESDAEIPPLVDQLRELKVFYQKHE